MHKKRNSCPNKPQRVIYMPVISQDKQSVQEGMDLSIVALGHLHFFAFASSKLAADMGMGGIGTSPHSYDL